MVRVLITAYEPYERFVENASWLALVELAKDLPSEPQVTTRRYPVDFAEIRRCLEEDLAADYDVAILLGQAPGYAAIHLEAVGLNVGGQHGQDPGTFAPLIADGPIAYRSELPLGAWAERLRGAGIPARVSYHAGTFLCNAALYLSHYIAERKSLKTRSAFLHLPLAPSQVLSEPRDVASLPTSVSADAIRLILAEIASH